MRKSLRSLLTVVLLALPASAAAGPADDVREAFLTYKTAVILSNGQAAAAVVSNASHAHFRELADQALTLDHAGLQEIALTERLYTLLLRLSLEPGDLNSMSGEELVAYTVDRGWIGRSGAPRLEIGTSMVDGDSATAAILRPDGEETPYSLNFVRQQGQWRLDLVAMMELIHVAFETAQQESGFSEDEFVMRVLEQGTNRTVGPEIWSPPR
ncbi:MAG: hypothetical protein ACFCUW_01945 [Kiloniellaceae bacterium]